MSELTIGTRKWTRVEYDRLAEAEILGPEDRIELLGGEMIVKEPQYSPHATAIRLVARALRRVFGDGWDVSTQLPVALDEDSEPEPDAYVVQGRRFLVAKLVVSLLAVAVSIPWWRALGLIL